MTEEERKGWVALREIADQLDREADAAEGAALADRGSVRFSEGLRRASYVVRAALPEPAPGETE